MKLHISILVVALSTLIIGCDDGSSEKSNQIQKGIISGSLILENAEFVSEDFPTASIVDTAPNLEESYNNLNMPIYKGSELVVSSSISKGAAMGFIVKVEGENGYFKIPSINTTSANVRTNNNYAAFRVGVLSEINLGSFNLIYAVYDDQGRVSNNLTITVTVNESKTDSTFLDVHQWEIVLYKRFYNNEITQDSVIGPRNYTYLTYCNSGTAYISIPYVQSLEYNNYLNLLPTGKAIEEFVTSFTGIDYELTNGSCTIIYTDTIVGVDHWFGSWQFDQDLSKLTIVHSELNGAEISPYIQEYGVRLEDKKMILFQQSEYYSSVEEWHYSPRN